MTKRRLTEKEIEDILSFIKPNPKIPERTANSIVEINKKSLKSQLLEQYIYPQLIPELKSQIMRYYYTSIIQPAESVGVLAAQGIGEKNTQSTLNSFHHAGITEKTVVTGVPRFEELINATKSPKGVSCSIYFKSHTGSIKELRKAIGNSIVELRLGKITKKIEILDEILEEQWYKPFEILYSSRFRDFTHCIRLHLDTRILFEYSLTMSKIVESIENEYSDLVCVWSPDKYSFIDIFIETESIELPEKISFITPETKIPVYIEEVIIPNIEKLQVCGITGVLNAFYVKKDNEWMIETDGSNFSKILAHPLVDISRTRTNNIWEIYTTLGIQAAKKALYEEFMDIMSGINACHAKILVDWMTHSGTISSISRYTVKKAECGALSKCSFEETLTNLVSAGIYGETEITKGVSASIICGKRSKIGTGMFDIKMDLSLMKDTVSEKNIN
jgi:DNA-directed RNA polymerase beta' subunit